MNLPAQISSWRDLIGRTPLVELPNLLQDDRINIYGKLESFNLGGSMKDRPALHMLDQALSVGELSLGDTVVESSSGNMGVGLAQACRKLGLSFICVVDSGTNRSNIRLMEAFGATVEVVEQVPGMSLLATRLTRVRELLAELPGSYWPNQYENPNNAAAHQGTMAEIAEALNRSIDFLFCSAGTCGTIRGCIDFIKVHGLATRVVAVDAVGSAIFGSGSTSRRLIPGHGSSMRPSGFDADCVDDVLWVSDEECIQGCRFLLEREAILLGGSAGGVVQAVRRYEVRLPSDSTVVLLLPDSGERYLDTVYNDSWIKENDLLFERGQ